MKEHFLPVSKFLSLLWSWQYLRLSHTPLNRKYARTYSEKEGIKFFRNAKHEKISTKKKSILYIRVLEGEIFFTPHRVRHENFRVVMNTGGWIKNWKKNSRREVEINFAGKNNRSIALSPPLVLHPRTPPLPQHRLRSIQSLNNFVNIV